LKSTQLSSIEVKSVPEGLDTFPSLSDVEGASGAGVRHGDLSQAILTTLTQQLLSVVVLCGEERELRTINLSIYQSINPSTFPSINQSPTQSMNHSIHQPKMNIALFLSLTQ
jgi:hypothetical protein